MKKYFTHIISVFFLFVFLANGAGTMATYFFAKAEVAELLNNTETENSGKEKEEKLQEREWIHTETDLHFPPLIATSLDKSITPYTNYCKDVFLAVFTPPPEQA